MTHTQHIHHRAAKWNILAMQRGGLSRITLWRNKSKNRQPSIDLLQIDYKWAFWSYEGRERTSISGMNKYKRTVPSVLNGQSVLFYHYRSELPFSRQKRCPFPIVWMSPTSVEGHNKCRSKEQQLSSNLKVCCAQWHTQSERTPIQQTSRHA